MSQSQEARDAWLAERKTGIGGTDAAAILGTSPWASAWDVWMSKTGKGGEVRETEAMWWGRELEEIIAKRYTEATGRIVYDPERLFRHPEFDCLIGTPDRLVVGEKRGLEIKTAGIYSAGDWLEPGTDQIPQHYLVQVLHYMLVTGFRVWDVAVLIGASDFRIYTVRRDDEWCASMATMLTDWWIAHVVRGAEPPMDGSDAAGAYLQSKFPRDIGIVVDATIEADVAARALATAKATRDGAADEADRLENILKSMIGEASGIKSALGWKATWKAGKDVERVDWRALAEAFMDSAAFCNYIWAKYGNDAMVADSRIRLREEFTTRGPASRRFLFTPAEQMTR